MVGKSVRRAGELVARTAAGKVGRNSRKAAHSVARTLGDPKKTKRLITVGKLITPILAPAAIRAADGIRLLADQQRAKKLGVELDDVARYRGPTGRAKARIDALAAAVSDLRQRRTGDAQVQAFTEQADRTLSDLGSAANAAGPMPTARRRPTLAAIDRELDQLESELISQLVRTRA